MTKSGFIIIMMLQQIAQWRPTPYPIPFKTKVTEHSFTTLLGIKQLTPVYALICKIQGNINQHSLTFRCFPTQSSKIFTAPYLQNQVKAFCARHNEANPTGILLEFDHINRQIHTLLRIYPWQSFSDEFAFQSCVADYSKQIGQQTQQIFKSILVNIFDVDLGPSDREQFLKKLRSMIMSSPHYKLLRTPAKANPTRTNFRSHFLKNINKNTMDKHVFNLAITHDAKCAQKYPSPLLPDFTAVSLLDQKKATTFLESDYLISYSNRQFYEFKVQIKPISSGNSFFNGYIPDINRYCRVQDISAEEFAHQEAILNKLRFNHLSIFSYVFLNESKRKRVLISGGELILQSLDDYLEAQQKDMTLLMKVGLMKDISHAVSYLHVNGVGYFLKMENIHVTASGKVLIYNFLNAYSPGQWKQTQTLTSNAIPCRARERDLPHVHYNPKDVDNEKCDMYSLGTVLYRVLFGKYPFNVAAAKPHADHPDCEPEFWPKLWTVETEYFQMRAGVIGKLLGNLILKCLCLTDIEERPYAEWLPAIFNAVQEQLRQPY